MANRPAISIGKVVAKPHSAAKTPRKAGYDRKDRFATEAVGEGSPDQLRRSEADEIGDDDELPAVLFSDVSERPMSGNAGIIASMANALSAINPASSTVISRVPGRFTPS